MFSCIFISCANIVPPDGGPIDETPPVLLIERPADSTLNTRTSKIELIFDKYMEVKELEKNFHVSPLLKIRPSVISYGKRVEIKIEDSLLAENTTYQLSFGNALVDNREATPLADYNYIFSTGNYFDSLTLTGKIMNAETGFPDSSAMVFLYPDTTSDSSILREKPQYVQKVDPTGNFKFSLLPNRQFKAFAIQDMNNNLTYDRYEEKIGFLDELIVPQHESDSFYMFYIFKEIIDSTSLMNAIADSMNMEGVSDSTLLSEKVEGIEETTAKERRGIGRSQRTGSDPYRVLVDTMNSNVRTMELDKYLQIEMNVVLGQIDSGKIYLSYDDKGIEVEAIQQLEVDEEFITIKTQWLEDKVYTLRLVKGWASDTSGNELTPGRYTFRTKQEEDYGKLRITIDSSYIGNEHVLYVFKGESDSIYSQPIMEEIVEIPLLAPGDYNMRIFIDENENGKWDPGTLLPRKHAEKVIPFSDKIILRSGWEHEVEFSKQKDPKEEALLQLKRKEDRLHHNHQHEESLEEPIEEPIEDLNKESE